MTGILKPGIATVSFLLAIVQIVTLVPYDGSGIADIGTSDMPQKIRDGIGSSFLENRGQWDPSILFKAKTPNGGIIIAKDHIELIIEFPCDPSGFREDHVTRIDFVGANRVNPIGEDAVSTEFNFFLGNDPTKWAAGIHGYKNVIYQDLWTGIDLVYRFGPQGFKYDLIVAPGADPSDIRFSVEGGEISAQNKVTLSIVTPVGTIVDSGLYATDRFGEVRASFCVQDDTYGFDIGCYDRSGVLIIDPNLDLLLFSTYFGGPYGEFTHCMDVDPDQNIFIGGSCAIELPCVSGHYQTSCKGWLDGFIVKMKEDGSDILFATYIGGREWDYVIDIQSDVNGDLYAIGTTDSSDFPTTMSGFDRSFNGQPGVPDIFVSKISKDGDKLIFSTFVGGTSTEEIRVNGLDLDKDGNVYVTGWTSSQDFPTTANAYQRTISTSDHADAFMFKLSATGSNMLYSTYFGGSDEENAFTLDYDDNGLVTIAGSTSSSDFKVTSNGPLTKLSGPSDGFISVLGIPTTGMGTLSYSTFLGGNGVDKVYDILFTKNGTIYSCGITNSTDYPVSPGAFGTCLENKEDGFVTVLEMQKSKLGASTYIGGIDSDSQRFIDVDISGMIHICGATRSLDYPLTENCFDVKYSDDNSVLYDLMECTYSILSLDCMDLVYSTFIGGIDMDWSVGFALSGPYSTIIGGCTSSLDFPIKEPAYQSKLGGDSHHLDAFVMDLLHVNLPGPPKILTAVPGDDLINITWSPPDSDGGSRIIDYAIFRGSNSGEYDLELKVGMATFFNDTTIQNGNTYYYAIAALNAAGKGPLSVETYAMPASVPSPPTKFKAVCESDVVNLSWVKPLDDGGINISGYLIFKSLESGPFKPIEVGPEELSYTDTSVEPGSRYYYYMTAENDIGQSDPTDTISTGPPGRPLPPRELNASFESGYVELSWRPPKDDGGLPLQYYCIYRSRSDISSDTFFKTSPIRLKYSDTDIEEGAVFTYRITAWNEKGESDPSNEVTVTAIKAPTPPSNLIALQSGTSVLLRWSPPSQEGKYGLLQYKVFRCTDSNWTEIAVILDGELQYLDETATMGQTYFYTIWAFNNIGGSGPSEIVNITLLGRPNAPESLTTISGDSCVNLSWCPPLNTGGSPLFSYRILRGNSAETLSVLTEIDSSAFSYGDATVENGLRYFYAVQTENSFGVSDMSNLVQADPVGRPSAPEIARLKPGDGSVEIAWRMPENDGGSILTSIILFRTPKDGVTIPIHLTDLDGNYTDTGLKNGLEYGYSISCSNIFGSSPITRPMTVTPSGLPDPPWGLEAGSIEGSVVLTWKAPIDDGGSQLICYNIYRSVNGSESVMIGEAPESSNKYVDVMGAEDLILVYTVTAVNANGESHCSNEALIEPQYDDGSEPRHLIIASVFVLILVGAILIVFLMMRKKKIENEDVRSESSLKNYPDPARVTGSLVTTEEMQQVPNHLSDLEEE